jgi:hypothetical protein
MRSTTLTAGNDLHYARQRTGYRLAAARRGAAASRRLQRASTSAAPAHAPAFAVGQRRSAEQILGGRGEPRTARTAASEAIARRVLIAIRVAMGVMFVACGLSGFIDFTPVQAGSVQGEAMAFGGALLLAGSLLPLLKGTEVIVETVLDLQRALGARRP